MALALPVIGALAGAGGAYFAGFTSLTALSMGASVGWMVGSWAMMATMDLKNDPLDTGANEAPRFNTAVRGAVVPILFGTNRVPAQIVWQTNFETIRTETNGGGGGKLGGSGGGKGPKVSGSTAYTYKIDAVYHLGMPVVPCDLLGGWLGGERVSNDSIIAISTNGAAFLSSNLDGEVGIGYDEAVFFTGDIYENETWSWLTSQVGTPIVWPGTTWIGFRGLNMGGTASMPQLNFEVGPGGGSFTSNTDPIAHHDDASAFNRATGIDANLNSYYDMQSGQKAGCFDRNGSGWVLDRTQFRQLFIDRGATGLSGSSLTNNWIIPIRNGTKLIWYMESTNTHTSRRCIYVGVSEIPAVGSTSPPALTNYLWVAVDALVNEPIQAFEFFDALGSATDLVFMAWRSDSGAIRLFLFPPLDEIERGIHKGTHAGVSGTTLVEDQGACISYELTHADFHNVGLEELVHDCTESHMRTGFAVSLLNPATLGITKRIYFYQNKRHMAGPNVTYQTGLYTNYSATYPNGAIFYLNFSPLYNYTNHILPVGETRDLLTIATAATVDNSSWVDSDGNSVVPFTDEMTRTFDGAAVTNSNKPCYSSNPYVERLNDYTWLVAFVMIDSDSYYTTYFGEEVLAAAIRAFYFDANTQKWIYIGKKTGFILGQGDLGVNWLNSASYSLGPPFEIEIIRKDSDIYLAGAMNADGFLTKFGTLDMEAQDVTPPYIIKQILVNEVFGIQPGGDIIDSTSYDVAVAYCELNNIKVSTQYRRAGSALAHIEMLLATYGGWLSVNTSTGKIKFGVMDLQNTPVRTIDNDHLLILRDGELPVKTSEGAIQDTYNIIRVNFIDRDMDYQNNQKEARDEVSEDLTGPRTKEFPPDFVMSPATAEKMADRALWTNLYVRNTHEFHLGWKDADLEPGDVVTLVDSHAQLNEVVQIVKWAETDRGVFQILATQQVPYVAGMIPSALSSGQLNGIIGGTISSSVGYLSNSGTVVHSGIVTDPSCRYTLEVLGGLPDPVFFEAYELPYEFSTQPEIYVGWRTNKFAKGANLYLSPDGVSYASVLNIEPHPVAGKLLTELFGNEQQVFAEDVEFILHPTNSWSVNSPDYTHNATLNDVTPAGMHVGAGLMYVGSEMLAYTGLELVAQNRYRAARMYRGWGGTKVSSHSSGDNFVKHGSGIFARTYTIDQIGTLFYYKVAPYNASGVEYDVSSVTAKTYTIKGQYYRPASPPEIRVNSIRAERRINVGSDGDILLNWEDGSRNSGHGAGGYGTAPGGYGGFTLDTNSHAWRVVVTGSGNTVVRSTVVGSPNFTYTRAMNISDNGAWRGNCGVQVTAFSAYGDSPRSKVASLELFY